MLPEPLKVPERQRVLVCAVKAPWPPIGGADLRCWQTLQILAGLADVALFALAGPSQPPPGSAFAVWRVAGQSVLALETGDPSWVARPNGLPSDAYFSEATAAQLRSVLETFAPGVVVLDQLWVHSYASILRASGARVVLNAHNVEALVARELEAGERRPAARLLRRRFSDGVANMEAELARLADQVWVCSEQDCERMMATYQLPSPPHVVPNAIDTARYHGPAAQRPAAFEGPGPFFLFSGLFHYAPNQRAVEFLIGDLFPALAARHPHARLLLVGTGPTPAMLAAAAADPRIVVTGRVPDVLPYLQHASMMLVPLFEGGGTRFKIIEAFAAGLPVVSSAKGAEGLGAEPGKHLLLAGDLAGFVEAAECVLASGADVAQRVAAAAEFAEAFSLASVAPAVRRALEELK